MYPFQKYQELLFTTLHDIITCLPNELIRVIVSFHQPTLDHLVEINVIKLERVDILLVNYKNEMYVSNPSNMDVMNADGTTKRSFKWHSDFRFDVIDDKIYARQKQPPYRYTTSVYDMNGKYLEAFSLSTFKKLIKIGDQRFIALSNESRLCTVDSKGNILHRSEESNLYGLVRYKDVNYVGRISTIYMYNNVCASMGRFDISNHCDRIYLMSIHQNMIFIYGSYKLKEKIFVFDMNGSFICDYNHANCNMEPIGNEIWVTEFGQSIIKRLECRYK